MACRITASIWFYFFGSIWFYPWRKRVIDFFKDRIWKSDYFWHDSFGKYWNRMIGCRLHGHRHKVWFKEGEGCGRDEAHWYCFDCERTIDCD